VVKILTTSRKALALAFSFLGILLLAVAAYTSLVLGLRPSAWVPLALADSINPCEIVTQATIGVSVALSSAPMTGFLVALFYAMGVVTSYYFIGVGLSFVATLIPTWVAGSVAVAYGSMTLLKALNSSSEDSCPSCVDRGVRGLRWLNWGLLGAYALGLLIGLTISPCTLGPYPIFLTLIKDLDPAGRAIALLGYNLIFGAPLFLVSLLIGAAEASQRLQLAIAKNYYRLRVLSSLLAISIGAYVIYLYRP